MTDATGQQISLDADVLEGTSDGIQLTYQTADGQSVTTLASDNAADIVSKAFTTMADGSGQNVEYITMTPEEAAAAGVVANAEEEQVVTTSLQFDPANPSVLYTADGTPINQADLTPEEQELVQAALQQHLAEQEAEQQLSMMQQQAEAAQGHAEVTQAVIGHSSEGELVTSTSLIGQPAVDGTAVMASVTDAADATVSSSGDMVQDGINLSSPTTSASQIVQSLADSVRRQQMQDQIHRDPVAKPIVTPKSTMRGGEGSLAGGIKYEEKIVIRQGQPQVVKVPVKRKPEIPAALANLMPKVEIGKDGSQVIRIHQSQITPSQLKALQENPNVRLVFRPAASSRGAASKQPVIRPKKRGRPPKSQTQQEPLARISSAMEEEPALDDPPSKTRCGRLSKRPVYTRDYLTPKLAQGMEEEDQIVDPVDDNFLPKSSFPPSPKRPRGRPPGNKNANKRSGSYASKIEALRNQDNNDSQIVTPNKPTLTPIEQAISTRRKNRLREMLGACSQDEIMEVAMPHLARVFSLWEFLITKVEKNKMTRVFFADVYKEYECLHKYVSKLAEKYKQVTENDKPTSETAETPSESTDAKKTDEEEKKEGEGAEKENEEKKTEEKKEEEGVKEDGTKPKMVTVTCKKLAESLGLESTTLVDAEIQLLDPEEAIGPRLIGKAPSGVRRVGHTHKIENKNIKAKNYTLPMAEQKLSKQMENKPETPLSKPVQTEATSTIPQPNSPTKTTVMPPLKPLGQTTTKAGKEAAEATGTVPSDPAAVTSNVVETKEPQPESITMDTEASAPDQVEAMQTEVGGEAATGTGTQLIQIGQGEDQQFIEVPEGYTLIQTPEGLVMSQPGTTISQGEDGTIYVTHADGTTTPLNAAQQQGVPMETVESLLSLESQKGQG